MLANIIDRNKGITGITYNHLNLPTNVVMTDGNIQYIYDAAGVKIKKIVNNTSESSLTTTEYAGNYIYENDNLQFFNTAEGYVELVTSSGVETYDYIYQYKDHLGNIRLSYSDDNGDGTVATSEIREENNYYPFGLKHKGYNNIVSANANSVAGRFKYNGVEQEESLGLDLYEMDWRQYDPAIGRFTAIDPITHYYQSTYTAFDDNPIFYADPSGTTSTAEWMEENGITQDDLITVYQAEDSESSDSGGCDDCSKCPETCNDSKSSNAKNDSTNNTDWAGIGLGIDATNNFVLPAIKEGLVLTTIPVYNEAGELIGRWTSYSKVPFKALKSVKGVLKPLGPIGNAVGFASNTEQVATGEMSIGRYAFNTAGTGGTIYAAAAYGGPVGVGVGGLVYLGDMTYKAIEEIGEAKANHPNPKIRNSKWYDFGTTWKEIKNVFRNAMPTW